MASGDQQLSGGPAGDREGLEPSYPGAVPPERRGSFVSSGLRVQTYEWGDPKARPVLLCHGMFDHSRGFDCLAPMLASRFRVVGMDARGHGDSDWADAYSWPADIRDIGNALEWLDEATHLVGHSKGGGQVTDASIHYAERVRQVVNIDGFGPPLDGAGPKFGPPRDLSPPERFAAHLDRTRRHAARRFDWRPSPSLDELVARRGAQNPRLTPEWLRYFLHFAARESSDGWRWKADPRVGQGFGPWQPEWIGESWRGVGVPMLAVVGTEPDTWGPLPDELLDQRLQHLRNVQLAKIEGTGHFVHMERPKETADLLLAFLDA